MAKSKNRALGVVLILLVGFVVLFGSGLLSGRITGGLVESDIDINSRANIKLERMYGGYNYPLESGDRYELSTEYNYELLVTVVPISNTWSLPANGRVELVVGGVVTGVHLVRDLIKYNSLGLNYYQFSWSLNNVPQGEYQAQVVFSGSWAETRDDTMFVTTLIGGSVIFTVDKLLVANPDAIVLQYDGVDITVDPFTTTTLTWNYMYAGPIRAVLTDEDVVLKSIELPASLSLTSFVYDYYARFSGYHTLTLTISPIDGSDNDAVLSSVQVYITIGGETTRFPPTVERVDIAVTTTLYETGVRQDYTWALFTEAPSLQLSQTTVAGEFIVSIICTPADALTSVIVTVSNLPTPISYNAILMGAEWRVTINTDSLVDGIHTITVDGVDRTNGQEYNLGTFDIAVRVGGPNPLFMGGVVIVGVIGVGLIVLLRRRR